MKYKIDCPFVMKDDLKNKFSVQWDYKGKYWFSYNEDISKKSQDWINENKKNYDLTPKYKTKKSDFRQDWQDPDEMDMPAWDPIKKRWYDLEW